MEPDKATGPIYCCSSYLHEVDEKRRVQIPAKWRPAEPGAELTLILWPQSKEGPCIRAKYSEQMGDLLKELNAMPKSDPRKIALKRFIGDQSNQVTVDKVGRICLPESIAQAAGIGEQAMLVGLLDQFEIWNPERYERVKSSDAILAEEAFKLMD
jgi:MraZ protein